MDDSNQEARTVLDYILRLDLSNCAVHVCVASYMADDQVPIFQRLQLHIDLMGEFRGVVASCLKLWRKDREEQQLVLWPHLDGRTPEPYEFEYLDLDKYDHIRAQIEGLVAVPFISLPVFTAADDVISGIRFYVITIQPSTGAPVHFFRTYTPKRELSRSHWFAALLDDGQFNKSKTPTFLFDNHIDCFSIGQHMFVVQKTNFRAIFRFLELVAQTATQTLSIIQSRIPIHNFDQFAEDCQAHLQKLAKLRNIAHQPYLATITMNDIRDVITRVPGLKIRIESVNGVEMLVYDRVDRWAILRLLDNHFMQSLLTKGIYDANSSRLLSAEERGD